MEEGREENASIVCPFCVETRNQVKVEEREGQGCIDEEDCGVGGVEHSVRLRKERERVEWKKK